MSEPASRNDGSAEKDILNLEEAALLLGISLKTFQKVLREGDIPGRKIGREWKFSRRALIEWVGSGHSRDFRELDEAQEILSKQQSLEPGLELEVEED